MPIDGVFTSQIFVLVFGVSQGILILSLVHVGGKLLVRGLSDVLALAPEDVFSVDFILLPYGSMKMVPELNVETEVDLDTLSSSLSCFTCGKIIQMYLTWKYWWWLSWKMQSGCQGCHQSALKVIPEWSMMP